MGLKRVGHDLATNTPNTHTHLSSFILYILYIIFLKEGIETNKPKMYKWQSLSDTHINYYFLKFSKFIFIQSLKCDEISWFLLFSH